MNLLEPLILLRLLAGGVTAAVFAAAAVVALRVLRYRHLREATEGQLALERQGELAATMAYVGAILQVSTLVMSVLAADRLSTVIRGAMCGYGVVSANGWGWASLAATTIAALGSALLLSIFALDRDVRSLDLLRPLAVGILLLTPVAFLDLTLSAAWLLRVDLTVVASCCSAGIDAAAEQAQAFARGPRALATWGTVLAVPVTIAAAVAAARRPSRARVAATAIATLVAFPLAAGASVLEVAPHVYEVPWHLCPFCLLRADAYFIGYPLFGGLFFAVVSGAGAALGALVAGDPAVRPAFARFARVRMVRTAVAWGAAFAVGAWPILSYALSSGGASLFR